MPERPGGTTLIARAVALLLALFLKEIPLSDVAGMVARGEAIGGEEAERLEAEQRSTPPASEDPEPVTSPERDAPPR